MRPNKSTYPWALCAGTILILLCGGLRAQTLSIGVAITSPPHGSSFDATSPFYNPGLQTLVVSGAVNGITALTAPNYYVLVQGMNVSLIFQPNGTATFQTNIPAGPNPPPAFGFWPSWYPYRGDWMDVNHIQKPILAEVYDITGQRVLSRTRNVIYDKRTDPGFQPLYTATVTGGPAFEMTARGLNTLEAGHTSTLPLPSRAAFDATLTSGFAGLAQTVGGLDTSLNGGNTACIALDQADPEFQNTGAWRTVSSNAVIQLTAYEIARQANPQTAVEAAIVASACVKNRVDPSDFELCVRTVKGTSQDLHLSSVDRTDLEIGTSTPIQSKVYLGRLSGTVDGKLRDLFIRYRRNRLQPCLFPVFRPRADIDNSDLTGTPALAAWTFCPNLGLAALAPRTPDWVPFTISQDASNFERNLVQAGTPPSPIFTLGGNRSENTNHGQCSRQEFSPYVQTLLQSYYDRMQTALDSAWKQGQPNTQQAVALDKLFSRWEPGIYGDQAGNDYTATLEYNGGPIGYMQDRIFVDGLSSEVHARSQALVTTPPVNWIYSPPAPFPCLDPLQAPCLSGRSFFGSQFDVSYSVTTGALNQVLRELSATRSLRFEFRPTYDDLGLAPPPGQAGTDRPVLDGTLLQGFAPPFKDLGTTTAHIMLQPTFLPFTWINPDPGPVAAGRAPLTYNMNHFFVDIVGDAPGPNGSTLWLRGLMDFYDPQFNMSLDSNAARNLLQPAMSGGERWTFTILQSQLTTSCPMSPMTQALPPIVILPCNRQLSGAIANLVRPVLNNRLLDMLSHYPAPLTYDAAGSIASPKTLSQIDKYQWQQVITFYGNLQ